MAQVSAGKDPAKDHVLRSSNIQKITFCGAATFKSAVRREGACGPPAFGPLLPGEENASPIPGGAEQNIFSGRAGADRFGFFLLFREYSQPSFPERRQGGAGNLSGKNGERKFSREEACRKFFLRRTERERLFEGRFREREQIGDKNPLERRQGREGSSENGGSGKKRLRRASEKTVI